MTIEWPIAALPPQSINVDIASRTLAGPASISGVSQVTASDAGLWSIAYSNIVVHGNKMIVLWQAIAAKVEGRLNPILVSIPVKGRRPVPAEAEAAGLYNQVAFSDDALFDDDTGFLNTVIDVVLSAPAAARAVSASVTIAYADTLNPGQLFSIGERLYRLHSVDYTGAGTANISFRPPLREAVAAGDRLEFDRPKCRVKLVSDQGMDLPFGANLTVFPTVNFIEDLAS